MTAQAVVYKWAVPVDDHTHPLPWAEDADVVHVAPDPDDLATVLVWTRQALPARAPKDRLLRVYGTGQPILVPSRHLGTAVTRVGLVWHLVELT